MSFGHFSVTPKEHRERKPFQAFRRANDLRKKNAQSQDAGIRVGNPWGDTIKRNWIDKVAGILVLCLVLLSAFFIWKWYSKLPEYEAKKAAVTQSTQSMNAKQDYEFLIKSGNENLYYGDLSTAKSDFENALKINPNSLKAADGLAKVLTRYCETKNLFCIEAAQRQQYLDKLHMLKN